MGDFHIWKICEKIHKSTFSLVLKLEKAPEISIYDFSYIPYILFSRFLESEVSWKFTDPFIFHKIQWFKFFVNFYNSETSLMKSLDNFSYRNSWIILRS